jgi:hypothetical protein
MRRPTLRPWCSSWPESPTPRLFRGRNRIEYRRHIGDSLQTPNQLDLSLAEARRSSTLAALLSERIEAYKRHIRADFFDRWFSSFNRQVMLVDLLGALFVGHLALLTADLWPVPSWLAPNCTSMARDQASPDYASPQVSCRGVTCSIGTFRNE